jgi:hypothetical protein
MNKKDIHDMLLEIGGYRPDGPNNTVSGHEFEPTKSGFHQGLKIEPQKPFSDPWRLEPWQEELKNTLLSRPQRKDVFVNVMPAAGKTFPLVSAWSDSINYNPNKQFDKICWVCPTVQLSNQVFHEDLKPAILKVIRQNIQDPRLLALLKSTGPTFQYNSPYNMPSPGNVDISDIPNQHILPLISHFLEFAGCLRTGSGSIGTVHKDLRFATCTYSFAPNIIKTQNPDIVVIDELQQYFPIYQSTNTDSDKDKIDEFIKTLESIPKTSSLVFLTGSMNKETAEQILKFINSAFRRRLVYLNAPNAKNRAFINVIPHSKLKTQQDFINYYSSNNKDKYNIATEAFKIKGDTFIEATKGLSDIKSDKDSTGKTIEDSRKKKVIKYINTYIHVYIHG